MKFIDLLIVSIIILFHFQTNHLNIYTHFGLITKTKNSTTVCMTLLYLLRLLPIFMIGSLTYHFFVVQVLATLFYTFCDAILLQNRMAPRNRYLQQKKRKKKEKISNYNQTRRDKNRLEKYCVQKINKFLLNVSFRMSLSE